MTATATNRQIWDGIYERGARLWYPAEALVRLVRRREQEGGFAGVILDHGCGSGNVAEFLVRSGHSVHCTEISPAALNTLAQRFRGAMLPLPASQLIEPDRPLRAQLPEYSHVVAWQSLYYADLPTVRSNIAELIEGLPQGGAFILCLPTPNDLAYHHSDGLPDGSRRLRDNVSGQQGAVVTIPASADVLVDWCGGLSVHDVVTFGMRFRGEPSEFFALYGSKS